MPVVCLLQLSKAHYRLLPCALLWCRCCACFSSFVFCGGLCGFCSEVGMTNWCFRFLFFSLYPWTSFFFLQSVSTHKPKIANVETEKENEPNKLSSNHSLQFEIASVDRKKERERDSKEREPSQGLSWDGVPLLSLFLSSLSTLCPTRILLPSTAITQSHNHTTTTGHPLVSSRLLVSPPHSFLEGSKEHNQNNQNPKIQLSTAWSTSLPS